MALATSCDKGGLKMAETELHVVTGALGYSGKYIAKRLLAEGKTVRTLTKFT